jgi:hypothetical protein
VFKLQFWLLSPDGTRAPSLSNVSSKKLLWWEEKHDSALKTSLRRMFLILSGKNWLSVKEYCKNICHKTPGSFSTSWQSPASIGQHSADRRWPRGGWRNKGRVWAATLKCPGGVMDMGCKKVWEAWAKGEQWRANVLISGVISLQCAYFNL